MKKTHTRDGICSGEDWRSFLGALRVFNDLLDEGVFINNVLKAHIAELYQNFEAIAEEPLRDFVGKLCQLQDPMLLRRTLLRYNVRGVETTPVHYDHSFLWAGSPTSITAWIPLVGCTLVGGRLMYLENSVSVR